MAEKRGGAGDGPDVLGILSGLIFTKETTDCVRTLLASADGKELDTEIDPSVTEKLNAATTESDAACSVFECQHARCTRVEAAQFANNHVIRLPEATSGECYMQKLGAELLSLRTRK